MSENKYLKVNIHCFGFKLWECDAFIVFVVVVFSLQVMSHSELKCECVEKKNRLEIRHGRKEDIAKNFHLRRQNPVYDLPANQR